MSGELAFTSHRYTTSDVKVQNMLRGKCGAKGFNCFWESSRCHFVGRRGAKRGWWEDKTWGNGKEQEARLIKSTQWGARNLMWGPGLQSTCNHGDRWPLKSWEHKNKTKGVTRSLTIKHVCVAFRWNHFKFPLKQLHVPIPCVISIYSKETF